MNHPPIPRRALAALGLCTLALFPGAARATDAPVILAPDRIFDGTAMRAGPAVLVDPATGRIAALGAADDLARTHPGARLRRLQGATLLPGLIDAHTHVLLHPYDETSWTDQVLKESAAERIARAVRHLEATLAAGFTTIRDLGTEGLGYADVGLRQALEKGVIRGPRLVTAGPAIVASGSYAPKGFAPRVAVPQGAEEADGPALVTVARRQIGHGIDWVKVYADYRWGPGGLARPTFLPEELRQLVAVAASSGRPVAAHAGTAEGMRRAAEAGVRSIEHGDEGDEAVFRLMAARGVWYCPTLAASEAVARYAGWDGRAPEPERLVAKRRAFQAALKAGVKICMGSDAGVFAHGGNVRELELMVAWGMTPLAALAAATSGDAEMLGLGGEIGRLAPGYVADLVVVDGDPAADISALRHVVAVYQAGRCVHGAC
ncbi:MAG: hypothetical protein KatS3mg119_0945 [Rhodothalassiaceae bacterium]|nr:MAG: hypothetical protein KatS3mg119_0945 [Rhodothalassiaceae bacterium]